MLGPLGIAPFIIISNYTYILQLLLAVRASFGNRYCIVALDHYRKEILEQLGNRYPRYSIAALIHYRGDILYRGPPSCFSVF